MNPPPDRPRKETQSIRSDIDATRQRMDQKIDALGERLKGRHFVDEVVGYFRSKEGNGNGRQLKEKITETAGSAVHAVVDSVKAHPLPSLLIGAGVAWFIYENAKPAVKRTPGRNPGVSDTVGEVPYDPDAGDAPYGYYPEELVEGEEHVSPATPVTTDRSSGVDTGGTEWDLENPQERTSDTNPPLARRARRAAAQVGQRIQARTRIVRERAREAYLQGRRQVSETVDKRPLEVGLGLLALGLVAGLALPTPKKVNELAGPTADRLRQRARDGGRDLVQRGTRVAKAAAAAVSKEAREQGLSPGSGGAVPETAPGASPPATTT